MMSDIQSEIRARIHESISPLKKISKMVVRDSPERDDLGLVKPKEKISVERAVESDGQMKGVGDLLEPFVFDSALKDRGDVFQKGEIPRSHLFIQARLDVETGPSALGEKEPNKGDVLAKPFARARI